VQYLLMCCFNETAWEEIPESQRDALMREYGEWVQSTAQSGHYRAGAKLHGISSATTIRGNYGKPAIVDGPFAETKEQLGGYYLIDVPDLDAAVKWAGKCPGAKTGSCEVRPLAPSPK